MAIPDTNGIFIHNGLNCTPPYVPTAQSIPMSPSDSTTVKTVVDNKSDLSIIANEYDTSATYTIGDFVIYDKVLYKCIMYSTTGDWDSTRWVAVNSKDSGINLKNSSGNTLVKIWEDSLGCGTISLYDKTTGYDTVSLNGYGDIDAKSITVMTSGSSNSGRVILTTTQSNSGRIYLRDDNKNTPIELNADDGNINAVSLNGVIIGSSPKFTDTTYESKTAASGGIDLSLVTTGEKYTWNNKADKVALPDEYDDTSTYALGDFVTYNNNIYQCKTTISTAEAWNSAHWTLVTPDADYLHSINPNGNGSFSLNRNSGTTVGHCSFAEGYRNTASGSYSHAEGWDNNAQGVSSHAEGVATTASGSYSHAEGGYTKASGDSSHAEGYQSTASGDNSHAEGRYTTASGSYSHADGYYTTANHRSQHVFGEYNILDGSSASATAKGNYVEIVGNGASNNAPSNARTLDWSGNEVLAGSITATGGNIVDSNNTNTITLTGSTGDITCSNATANVFIANSYIRNQSAIMYNGNSNPNYLYAVHYATNARAINEICVNMAGTGGSVGFCRVCRITVTSGYIDGAAEFKIWHRGANRPWFVYLKFASNSGTDPDVGSFKYYFPAGTGISIYGAYIVKTATSNWELYIRKAQNWDDISIQVTMPRYIAGGVNMTYDPYFVTSLPSGYITATSF